MRMACVWHSMDGDEPCGVRVDGIAPGSVEWVTVLHLKASQEGADLTEKRVQPDSQRLSWPSWLPILLVGYPEEQWKG